LIRSAQAGQMFADLSRSATAVIVDDARFRKNADALTETLPIVIRMGDDAPASEFTIEALSGLLDLVGDPEREPLRLGGHQTAYAAGLAAYLGMIGALARGDGKQARGPVRVSLLETAVWLNWKTLGTASRNGESPTRPGATAEWHVVACADGFAALVYRTPEWEAMLAVANDARLREERFQSAEGRRAHGRELNRILAEAFAGMTRVEIRNISLKKGLPLGPVWSPSELIGDAHMRARDFFSDVAIDGIAAKMPRLPVRWNGLSFVPAPATNATEAELRSLSG
jgi:crotonobetainyl-CoA:carnitine CoA-transferase CaiB-like acyl-CoA transferase